ncbi:MAG: hypothetical protein BIFFINMI_03624 [Phycisphaerae bacterium]|nr:hypothetical protein [Phycisphaerae bacterium]
MTAHREFRFGGERVAGEPLWACDFAGGEDYRVESQGGTCEFRDGRLHIDCVEKRGVTVWLRRDFPADLIIEYAGICHAPSTGRNFNCFFCATGPGGTSMERVAGLTGQYQLYHELPNYIFTLTCDHTRMRKDPGFVERTELMLGSVNEHRYVVQIVKRGPRLQAVIDGVLIHDWIDDAPLGAGWVGLRTWNTKIEYDLWAVYRPL